jgi:uncharacterized membrane protein
MKKNRLLLSLILISSPLIANADWSMSPAPSKAPKDFNGTIMNIINWLLGFVSLIAVLVIIYGGVLYLTAAGNDDQVRSGKETIKTGIMGIFIAGLAYAIVNVIVTTILQ